MIGPGLQCADLGGGHSGVLPPLYGSISEETAATEVLPGLVAAPAAVEDATASSASGATPSSLGAASDGEPASASASPAQPTLLSPLSPDLVRAHGTSPLNTLASALLKDHNPSKSVASQRNRGVTNSNTTPSGPKTQPAVGQEATGASASQGGEEEAARLEDLKEKLRLQAEALATGGCLLLLFLELIVRGSHVP